MWNTFNYAYVINIINKYYMQKEYTSHLYRLLTLLIASMETQSCKLTLTHTTLPADAYYYEMQELHESLWPLRNTI